MTLTELTRQIQLEPGDVVGVTDRSLLAMWLRHRQAGPFEGLRYRVATHVSGVIGCRPGGGVTLVEATTPHVREISDAREDGDVIFVWRPPLTGVDWFVRFLEDAEGTPYDFAAIAALCGIGKQDSRKWYCSELVAAALRKGGVVGDPDWRICVTPWDVQRYMEAVGQVIYRSYKPWW